MNEQQATGETMTTVEVTTTALPGDQPRVLSLRVTPEQEVAIYAFFQINGWSIITEGNVNKINVNISVNRLVALS